MRVRRIQLYRKAKGQKRYAGYTVIIDGAAVGRIVNEAVAVVTDMRKAVCSTLQRKHSVYHRLQLAVQETPGVYIARYRMIVLLQDAQALYDAGEEPVKALEEKEKGITEEMRRFDAKYRFCYKAEERCYAYATKHYVTALPGQKEAIAHILCSKVRRRCVLL